MLTGICNSHSRLPTDPPSRQYLLGVLDISHRYEVVTGVGWAIYHLERLNDMDSPPDTPGSHAALSPAHRLHIARRYQVESWVKPAVFEIVDRFSPDAKQIRFITDDDCNLMGYYAFGLITKGIESINAERLMISFTPPQVRHCVRCIEDGRRSERCSREWVKQWLNVMPCYLLRPDRREPLHSLISLIRWHIRVSPDGSDGILQECKEHTILAVEELGICQAEEQIKELVATKVWESYL